MTCLLCQAWARTPFATRYNTPVDTNDAHKLLGYGYALCKSGGEAPICEKHTKLVESFEHSIKAQQEAEAAANAPPPPAEVAARERIANLNKKTSAAARTVGYPAKVAVKPPENPIDAIVGNHAVVDEDPRFPCPKCGKTVAGGEVHPCV